MCLIRISHDFLAYVLYQHRNTDLSFLLVYNCEVGVTYLGNAYENNLAYDERTCIPLIHASV